MPATVERELLHKCKNVLVSGLSRLDHLLLRFSQSLGRELPVNSLHSSESRPLQAGLGDPPVPRPHEHVEDKEGKRRVLGTIPIVLLQNDLRPRI